MYWKGFSLYTDIFRYFCMFCIFARLFFYHVSARKSLHYFELTHVCNCSNIQPNWWKQHSYNKLWRLKYGWQTVKAIRSGCAVKPTQNHSCLRQQQQQQQQQQLIGCVVLDQLKLPSLFGVRCMTFLNFSYWIT